jgi:hypothetical protein
MSEAKKAPAKKPAKADSQSVLLVNPAGRAFPCPRGQYKALLKLQPHVVDEDGGVLSHGYRVASEDDRKAWLDRKAKQKAAREASITEKFRKEQIAANAMLSMVKGK